MRESVDKDKIFKCTSKNDNFFLEAHMRLIKRKAKNEADLDDGQLALLFNRMKAMEKDFNERRRKEGLVNGADALVRKVAKVSEVDEFFRKMNEDGIQKAKDFDPEFIEFIYENKVKPMAILKKSPNPVKAKYNSQPHHNHVTPMDK